MLSRVHRFHGHNALNFAYKQGSQVRSPLVSLKYTANPRRPTFRAAVVVSKKVSKSAVVRNRIRRRIYEALRQQAGGITGAYDLVFMVYGIELATLPATELGQLVAKQLLKAGVITVVSG